MSKRIPKMGWIALIALLCLAFGIFPACGSPGPTLPSAYIGSGALDGNGIPVNFFNDTNVRIGISYAFDYNTYLTQALSGQGMRLASPVPQGLYGYDNSTPMYTYNLTQARYYLEHSGWGNLSAIGFKFTVLYNAGNLPRKTACELLAEGLSKVSPNMQVSILPLAWPTILGKIFGTRDMPMFQIGWLPDYAHPDDYITPFMQSQGCYSYWQGYGSPELDAQIRAAFEETNTTAQLADYAALEQRYHDDAPGIMLAQMLARRYFTGHISGFYYNPCEVSYPGRLLDLTKADNVSSSIPYKNDGTFVYQTIGDAETLDPGWVYDTSSAQQIEQMYETLIYYNRTSMTDFIPLLATNWTFNSTDNTWRFTIRDGVKFWNNHTLTAEDVQYSIERQMVMDRPGGASCLLLMPLCDVMTVDDTNFTAISNAVQVDGNDVVFKVVNAAWQLAFEQILCGQWASIVDKDWCIAQGDWNGTEAGMATFSHPADPGDTKLFDHCMGTGPWMLNNWDQGVSITMDKNPDYWNEAETPVPFDHVVTQVVESWTNRRTALLAGDADIVDVPATNFPEMDAYTGLNVYKNLPSLAVDCFYFNMIIGGPSS
jgi:ABC-type transport system substrate-binding protein